MMQSSFEERPNEKYKLPNDVLDFLRTIYIEAACFIALHGSILWEYREPRDVDVLYILDNKKTAVMVNHSFGQYDITVMTRKVFEWYVTRMDVQYMIFLWLPEKYILSINSDFREYLDENGCACRTKPYCIDLIMRTNQEETERSWQKARRMLVLQNEPDKSMKSVFCAFRRVLMMQMLVAKGMIDNFQIANKWWPIIIALYDDSSFTLLWKHWNYIDLCLAGHLHNELERVKGTRPRRVIGDRCTMCLQKCEEPVVFTKCQHVVHRMCLKRACLSAVSTISKCPQKSCQKSVTFFRESVAIDDCQLSSSVLIRRTLTLRKEADKLTSFDHLSQLCENVSQRLSRLEFIPLLNQPHKMSVILESQDSSSPITCQLNGLSACDAALILNLRIENDLLVAGLINGNDVLSIQLKDINTYRSLKETIAKLLGITDYAVELKRDQKMSALQEEEIFDAEFKNIETCFIAVRPEKEAKVRYTLELYKRRNSLADIREQLRSLRQKLQSCKKILPAPSTQAEKKSRHRDPLNLQFKNRRAAYKAKQELFHENRLSSRDKLGSKEVENINKPRTKLRHKRSGKKNKLDKAEMYRYY